MVLPACLYRRTGFHCIDSTTCLLLPVAIHVLSGGYLAFGGYRFRTLLLPLPETSDTAASPGGGLAKHPAGRLDDVADHLSLYLRAYIRLVRIRPFTAFRCIDTHSVLSVLDTAADEWWKVCQSRHIQVF